MNIYSAYISDLRPANKRPVLVVVTDGMPVASNPIIRRSRFQLDWTSAKYGPLIEFTARDAIVGTDGLGKELSPAAQYNVVFADGLAPVVDVRVIVKQPGLRLTEGDVLDGYWALQLRRARSIVKRFELPYRLVMSDWEGTHGRTGWVPVPSLPTCDAELLLDPIEHQCSRRAHEHLSLRGIDYWLCMRHLADHHAKHFAARHRK